ncbi:hypothetical protein ACH4TX_15990 [Streptomyces sp. NPDC021098]|uniref:hypothetical protein n=1 Tax=unclassified Streptomyces TaxID=2593676 RepID=UPI0037B2A477
MMTNPDVVFAMESRRRLVARSGWEQEEARTVLRDLGWEWEEELHALVPPDDVAEPDSGVQAVKELHLHGYRTGFAVGPYGAMRLDLERAEQVFTKIAAGQSPDMQNGETAREDHSTETTRRDEPVGSKPQQRSPYRCRAASEQVASYVSHESPPV